MRRIFNPMVHLCKILIALILIILWPALVNGAIIFSDNFDSCTANCSSVSRTPPNSAGWLMWNIGEGYGPGGPCLEYKGVTHCAGEITSPGRGGSGKSLKLWKTKGYFANFEGGLDLGTLPGYAPWKYRRLFLRYYVKIPVAFQFTGQWTGFKSWRWVADETNPDLGKVVYVNHLGGRGAPLGMMDSSGTGWWDLLPSMAPMWDGNWHSLEFEVDLGASYGSPGAARFWLDDQLKFERTNHVWNVHGTGIKEFVTWPIGNTMDHTGTWQEGWQAFEVDDFVISTTHIGPVSGGTDLTKQPNPPVNLQLR